MDKAIILHYSEKEMKEIGFRYQGKHGKYGWRFVRSHGDVEQYITFATNPFGENNIRVEFSTSKNMYGTLGNKFVTDRNLINALGYWAWDDEASLKKVFISLFDVIKEYGLEWFEMNLIPDIEPSPQKDRELLDNRIVLADSFMKEYDLTSYVPEHIEKIEQVLRESKTKATDWQKIMEASAFIGEVVRHNLGGNWEWDIGNETTCIKGIGGKENLAFLCFVEVTNYWDKPQFKINSLVSKYNRIKYFSNL